jgi:catechol 2,3-dioxygenase-like lactoylglutathione lyase family enzyme
MLTDARITAIVPTTDLARARSFYEETLGLTDSGASTPGPEVVYRCGGGTLLQVYERPTAGDAEHTLASWEVGDVRAAVDELRSRAYASRTMTSRSSRPRTASPQATAFRPPGSAIPTATSSAFIQRSGCSRPAALAGR